MSFVEPEVWTSKWEVGLTKDGEKMFVHLPEKVLQGVTRFEKKTRRERFF